LAAVLGEAGFAGGDSPPADSIAKTAIRARNMPAAYRRSPGDEVELSSIDDTL
jgi:hypothetical protein